MLKFISIASGAMALAVLSTGAFARDDARDTTPIAPISAPPAGASVHAEAKAPGHNRYAPYAAPEQRGQVFASGYYVSAAKHDAPHNRYTQ